MYKILVLYSSVTDYASACIDVLASQNQVVLVTSATLNDAPYNLKFQSKLKIYNRVELNDDDIYNVSIEFNPDLIYISGWIDKAYLKIGKYFVLKNRKVIMSLDNPWIGTIRQKFGLLYFRLFLSKCFTNALVAGLRQYEFARRLGFKYSEILVGMYSARISGFEKIDIDNRFLLKSEPKTLVYVGRLVDYKNVLLLYHTFNQLKIDLGLKFNWKLNIYGEGPVKSFLQPNDFVNVFDFIQPADLPIILEKVHAFCLPSTLENWGVVVHEMASSGLILLTNEGVLSNEQYVINGFNGYVFNTSNLKESLLKLNDLTDEQMLLMSYRSRVLSKRMNPEIWANNLLSLLK